MITYVTKNNLAEKTDEWLRGIAPFNTHNWRPDPLSSALLVIDCQNYFVEGPQPDGAPILPNIRSLIDCFRKAARPIIFTRHMHRADLSEAGILSEWWEDLIIENTPESELHPSLGVGPDDIVIRKNRYNAFRSRIFDECLKLNNIKDLIIVGVMTNLCCETTAREGFVRDYRIFFVADATGTACEEMHFASLMNIAYGFGIVLKTSDVEASIGG